MPYSFEDKRQDDGDYLDEEGISYANAEEYLGHQFSFCGCGCPEKALLFMRDVFHTLDTKGGSTKEWEERFKRQNEFWKSIPDGLMYIIWYLLDDKGFTEHGGSVPGWLTDKGLTMMHDLDVYAGELDG